MASVKTQSLILSGAICTLGAFSFLQAEPFRAAIKQQSAALYSSEKQAQAKPRKATQKGPLTLTINTVPADARVSVMNIKARYRPGMELPAGAYDIRVRAAGYKTLRTWVKLDAEHQVFQARLKKQ